MYEILRRSSPRASSRVFPFHSHRLSPPLPPTLSLLLFLSIGLFSLQSAVIFSCRSYFRRAHPTSSPEAALHGFALCALSRGPSCSLAGSNNWISRLARRSQSYPLAFLVSVANLVRIVNDIEQPKNRLPLSRYLSESCKSLRLNNLF